MKLSNIMLNIIFNILTPVIVTLSVPLATAFVSWLKTGNWRNLPKEIPLIYYIIFFILMLMWFIVLWVKKRDGEVKKYNQSSPLVGITPLYGWNKIAEFPYKDVIWEIQAQNEPWK